jgi:hypothetical protein
MFKNLLFIFVVITFFTRLSAQTLQYDWTNTFGGNNSEDAKDIAVAKDNSVYVVGQFMSTVDFNPGVGVNAFTVAIPNGYIAHYAADGTFINVIPILSSLITNCNGVEIDDSNNVYVSGSFSGTVDFDPGAGIAQRTSNGVTDLFIAKYSSSSQLIWVRQYGQTLNTHNFDLEYSKNKLAINGRFNGSISFSAGDTITAMGGYDIFALVLDTSGVFKWAKSFGNSGNEDSRSICLDAQQNVYLSGTFTGTIDVNPSSTIVNNIVSNGINGGDVFILKLDTAGNYTWVRTLNGGGAEFIFDMQTYGENLYVNGGFTWTVDFDPSPAFDTLVNVGGIDAFAWKLTQNGTHLWVRKVGNNSFDFYDGRTIAFTKTGKPYFLGIFEGSANFNKQGNNSLSSNGSFDVYVWALEPNGDFRWAKSFGGTDNDVGLAIATDSEDNLLLGGFYRLTVDFNPWVGVDNHSAAPSGPSVLADAFVSKWSKCEYNSNINIVSCTKPYNWNGQAYNADGLYSGFFVSADSCDSTVALNLSFQSIDTTVTVNQQVLSANQNGAVYQWYDCVTWQPINGANSQSFSTPINGSYAAIIQINGCTDTTVCSKINSLSLSNTETTSDVLLYPNPANDFLNVISSNNIQEIKMYSMDGKLIMQSKENTKALDVRNIKNGIYILAFTLENGYEFRKIWKK